MISDEEKIKVMQAHLDGAKIQYRHQKGEPWSFTGNPLWNWISHEYRIAEPTKEKVKVNAYRAPSGNLYLCVAGTVGDNYYSELNRFTPVEIDWGQTDE